MTSLPGKLTTRGFTLVEMMIAVTVVGLLLSIAVPGFMEARDISRQKSCIANLKLIDNAKQWYAAEHNAADGTVIQLTWLIGRYIKGPVFENSSAESVAAEFRCPSSGLPYGPVMGAIGEQPLCPTASARGGRHPHALP